jgi:hypothetical protein
MRGRGQAHWFKRRDSDSKQATATSFHLCFNSLFTYHFIDSIQSEIPIEVSKRSSKRQTAPPVLIVIYSKWKLEPHAPTPSISRKCFHRLSYHERVTDCLTFIQWSAETSRTLHCLPSQPVHLI